MDFSIILVIALLTPTFTLVDHIKHNSLLLSRDDIPWHVNLVAIIDDTTWGFYVFSGVLVSESFVLTDSNDLEDSVTSVMVVFDIRFTVGSVVHYLTAEGWHRHIKSSFALVKMSGIRRITVPWKAIRLPNYQEANPNFFDGAFAKVFAVSFNGTSRQYTVTSASVQVIHQNICKRKFAKVVEEYLICTLPQRNLCIYKTGAPLVSYRNGPVLVGILTSDLICGSPDHFFNYIYDGLGSSLKWISSVISSGD